MSKLIGKYVKWADFRFIYLCLCPLPPIQGGTSHVGYGVVPIGVCAGFCVALFSALSSKQENGFWPNLHRYIVGRRERID